MRRLRGALALSALTVLALACGPSKGAGGAKSTAGIAGAGAPSAAANESAEALRDRALASFDAGDLLAAETDLLELARRKQDSLAVRGLLDGLRAITGRNGVRAHAFLNVPPLAVGAMPPPMPPGNPAVLKIEKVRTTTQEEQDPDFEGTQQVWSSPLRHRDLTSSTPPTEELPFLPASFGGNMLLHHGSGGTDRWFGVYGRRYAEGRFVAVVDTKGRVTRMLDFGAWRSSKAGTGTGISYAAVRGNRVVVAVTVPPKSYLVGVDITTGAMWRSEPLGPSSSAFTVTSDRAFVPNTSKGLLVLDLATGATVGQAVQDAYGVAILRDGYVEVGTPYHAARDVIFGLRAPVQPPPPPQPPPRAEAAKKIAPSNLARESDVAERRSAFDLLDANQMQEALLKLRPLVDRNPANLAIESLYEASLVASAFARQRAGDALGKLPATPAAALTKTDVAAKNAGTRTRHPRLRLIDETSGSNDRSRWWTVEGIEPNTFGQDESPGEDPIAPLPLWLPPSFGSFSLTTNLRGKDAVTATYRGSGTSRVFAFREGKPTVSLSFDSAAGYNGILAAEVANGVAYIVTWDNKSNTRCVAVEAASGAVVWSTTIGRGVEGFVLVDGYLIASVDDSPKPSAIVAVDAESGRVVSRLATPNNGGTYWLARTSTGIFGVGHGGRIRIAIDGAK